MRVLDRRLIGVVVSLLIVLYLAINVKSDFDSFNSDRERLSNYIYNLEMCFRNHIDMIEQSIINLHFNNDVFVQSMRSSRLLEEKFRNIEGDLHENYSSVISGLTKYRRLIQNIKEDTLHFIRINAKIKNSLSILERNLKSNLDLYSREYSENLINLVLQFQSLKNDVSVVNNIPKTLFEFFKNYQVDNELYQINYIHIELLYNNITKFKSRFHSIVDSGAIALLNDIKRKLNKRAEDINNEMKLKFFIVIVLYIALFIFIIILVQNLRHDSVKILKLQRKSEEDLKRDSLTSLLNRSAFTLESKEFNKHSIILLDIIDFNSINLVTGYEGGDEALIHISNILREFVKSDFRCLNRVYRVDVDQFVVVTESTNYEELKDLAESLISKIETATFSYKGLEFPIYIQSSISSDKPYLKTAETALNKTKESSRKISIYSSNMESKKGAISNLEMLSEVKEALRDNRIFPFFQPIIDLKSREVVKYEALVRLIDTNSKPVSPYFFLELSKKSKLYVQITEIVIEKSILFIRESGIPVSINLSYNDIVDVSTQNFLASILEKNRDISHKITFELLESEDIENYNNVIKFINFIKRFNCSIAIDDFGSGYSNFVHLFNMRPDIVKIDGSIIRDVDKSVKSRNIVEALVSLSKKSNIQTVAEFVDSESIDKVLTELGVDMGQLSILSSKRSFK